MAAAAQQQPGAPVPAALSNPQFVASGAAAGRDRSWYRAEDTKQSCTRKLIEKVDILAQTAKADGQPFRDLDFSPCVRHVTPFAEELYRCGVPVPAEWKRLDHVYPHAALFPEPAAVSSSSASPSPSPSGDEEILPLVYEGRLSNCECITAIQMVASRPRVLRNVFARYDRSACVYGLRLFKNGLWVETLVDDKVPVDGKFLHDPSTHSQGSSGGAGAAGRRGSLWGPGGKREKRELEESIWSSQGLPVFCRSSNELQIWGPLVEKALAKSLDSYELLSLGSPRVEDFLADLTGGLTGRFSVKAIAPDRLFVYISEKMPGSLFCLRADKQMVKGLGAALNIRGHAHFVVSGAVMWEGAPFYLLRDQQRLASGPFDGFFWVPAQDVQHLFATVIECRLVPLAGVPRDLNPQLPGCPLYFQSLHATRQPTSAESPPEFILDLRGSGQSGHNGSVSSSRGAGWGEVRVGLCVSQEDMRMAFGLGQIEELPDPSPLLIRVFAKVAEAADDWALVCQSDWIPQRDTCVAFTATGPGKFLVTCHLPEQGTGRPKSLRRLILRVHHTSRSPAGLSVDARGKPGLNRKWVVPGDSLNARNDSFWGFFPNRPEDEPREEHPDDGGKRIFCGVDLDQACALM
uniref:Calpain catalytic domain-containing protein n=1 Tax=Chromera velia CCMP2878 TaxID=1169474 RepID=A0A0G4HW49_9ALVE|eukprot:Cvel_8985.t1-p1 / transcript=Cvel_8985.t1 / gene=Cvel_8985 / organism=Chromera_velia_CCMP2878 / gene_product=hypothetical protein / transcript_product=hypothetical protein / location=Cvel_scaffold507:25323-33351(-) / protein_length=631 / sequence_SO=supercontig / SO=protein_coding / is_pseudo=false